MMRRIVVIGGGIAGLAAAHRLLELRRESASELEVMLLEASGRLGGCIGSERIGEFLIEAGPDSFISEKPWALRLCERIGLASSLLSTQPAYQKIYIVHKGELAALPEGFFLLAPTRLAPFLKTPLFSWGGKLRMAAELFVPRGDAERDESLGAFVRRRFGAEALERVAQPLIGGIYAADPDKLSLAATMPRFKEMEKTRRSVTLAMWSEQRRRARGRQTGSGARWSLFVTLAGGMQQLVDALAQRLAHGNVRLNTPVTTVSHDQRTRTWQVSTRSGENLYADAVVAAVPAFRAAAILAAAAPEAAKELAGVAHASTATVSLAYRMEDFPRPPDSFGFVAPAVESRKIMACTFSSLKYPGRAPQGHLLLRAFVGGSLQPELFQDDDATMAGQVRHEIADLLKVTADPLFVRVHRHPSSMPQYHMGHHARIERVESSVAGFGTIALAGNAYRGVGIADCVRSGEEAAERMFRRVVGVSTGAPAAD